MSLKIKKFCSSYFFKLLIISFIALLSIYFIPIIFNDFLGYDNSDGMVQYRVYIKSFFEAIDSHNLSFFNMNMLYGNSIFALEYYIPIDIFTLILYLLHFWIEFDYAFAFVRLLMIFTGTLTFFIMSKKVYNFSDKTSFFLSMFWIICGALSVYINYYVYCALYFYVPIAMYVFDLAHNKHKYIPLGVFTFILMLYNFYLGYMVIMVTIFITVTFNFMNRKDITLKQLFKKEFKQLAFDAIPVLLGVLSGAFLIIPTITYLLNNTSTDRTSTYYSIWHFIHLIARNFIPTFESFFSYVEQDRYINSQSSLFITIFGLLSMINLFLAHKEERKRYLCLIGVLLVMLGIPMFAWFFTASKSVYGRWYFLFALIELYYIGQNFEENNIELSSIKGKTKHIIALICSSLIISYMLIIAFNGKNATIRGMIIILGSCSLLILLGLLYINTKLYKKIFMTFEMLGALMLMFVCTLFSLYPKVYISAEKELYKVNAIENEYVNRYNIDAISSNLKINNSNSVTNVYSSEYSFFSSFWNNNANPFIQNYVTKKNNISWQFIAKNNTNIFTSTFLGTKYYVVNKDCDYIIPDYLRLVKEEDGLLYYENIYSNGFAIVYYDESKAVTNSYFENQFNLSKTCWINSKVTELPQTYKADFTEFSHVLENTDSEIVIDIKDFDLNTYYQFYDTVYQIKANYKDGTSKICLDTTILITDDMESLEFDLCKVDKYLTYSKCNKEKYEQELDNLSNRIGLDVQQDGDNFSFVFDKEDKKKAIVVLPITYSDEFVCDNYEIIRANGSFVGIVIPENTTGHLAIAVKFEPNGLKTGVAISSIFCVISLGTIISRIIYIKKKEK